MALQAVVLLKKSEFIAELSDGRRFGHGDLVELAAALHQAGVAAGAARCDWRSGHRMLTAGQQVALDAELRRLEKQGQEVSAAEAAPVAGRGIGLAA